MSQVKGIPYGISDFKRLRNENFYYVDKTMYLPLIEKMPSYLFLIRPRRFGKSLFLSLMRTYYDILQKDNFEKYFRRFMDWQPPDRPAQPLSGALLRFLKSRLFATGNRYDDQLQRLLRSDHQSVRT